MRVVKNTPPPAPEPPATYDVVGLTREELEVLYLLGGSIGGGDYQSANSVRHFTDKLYELGEEALGYTYKEFYGVAAARGLSGTLKVGGAK